MPGRFIVFEGPEGAGKSTQVRTLAATLSQEGVAVVTTREPGGTPLGDAVRALLLDQHDDVLPETEALLLSAARAQHVHEVIRPALARGEVVLCDRYADSTVAYQGAGGGMRMEDIACLRRVATGGLTPDLRILLDVPVEIGLQRRHGEAASVNRIDRADIAYHQRVRGSFLRLAEGAPADWAIIDASRPASEVAEDVARAARACLSA